MTANGGVSATEMTPETLAKVVSAAYRRRILPETVEKIAEKAGLIDANGRVNLLDFTIYLVEHGAET